ncbi:Crp/Fnr family transcriptional regulator [Corynebacterium sp. A21]|uniref:Crp/Fnr family transcriptional regulator n=1 Tax=Corynebacterium sp. A21 TaxID=3457318 RepID=UPI003FD2E694
MARSALTRDLTPEQHLDLDGHLSAWAWAEADPILLAGEESTGSYLVASGRARITRDTADGREITVDIAAPGDIIGPVHTEVVQAVDSAWAMETTCALFLPADALAEVVENYPPVALAMLRMQQGRLAQAREREIRQSTRTVEQRVAAVLQKLALKLGQRQADGAILLQVRLRRDDIAGMAGTTLESTSRTMSRMKRNGLIDSGREWVSVLDPGALEALSTEE